MFQISGKPAWASFSVSTGALTGTPAVSDVGGQANIVISVSDGRLSTALPAFALLVQPASVTPPANRAPTISGTPGTTAEVGTAYSFQPTAADADGDALTFTATNLPAWATLDANTGKLSGTPTGAGSHSAIGIAVTDGKVTVSLASFNITVAPVAPPGTIPAATACSSPLTGTHATYNVGGGANAYADLHTVPWLSLQAGDVVNIYYRTEPYRTRVALRAQGSASQPVVINGVTDANCNRPVISGTGATNAADQASGYHSGSDGLGNILIFWGSGHYAQKPRFITIQNLAITGGTTGIYAVTVDDLVVQNTQISDVNGWGVFVNSKNGTDVETSYRVTIRNNRIFNNGVSGSWLYHNLYIQAYRALYEGNYIGQLRVGAQGSSLKDRSSGTIIRYNHIVAALRALDLVETEDNMSIVGADPQYPNAWVYGNLIVNDHTLPASASTSLIHWGYDNTPANARRGTLYFYNNTVVSVNSSDNWFALFDQESSNSSTDPHNTVELRNNIIWHTGTAQMKMAEKLGTLNFLGTNWISSGWGNGDPWNPNGVMVNVLGTLIEGSTPGLNASYRPVSGSAAIGRAGSSPTPVTYEFKTPVGVQTRATAADLGAFEH